jgi:hypothetical protein
MQLNMIQDELELLPGALGDWKAEKIVIMNIPTDVYSYIDGGAELYLSYGFRKAISYTYKKDSHEVLAEVYDLIEGRNAFGVFTQTREEEVSKYGQGTYIIPGAVFFWKGNYYISLSAWESATETAAFIDTLAAYIDNKIPNTSQVPAVVGLMPESGLVPGGFKYFHHYIWLNSYFFISDENILNINKDTDALLAKYEDTDRRKYLLLVDYPGISEAKTAYSVFAGEFFPEGLKDNTLLLEDGTWISACLLDKTIIAIFNAASKQSAIQLLNNTIDNYQKKRKQ